MGTAKRTWSSKRVIATHDETARGTSAIDRRPRALLGGRRGLCGITHGAHSALGKSVRESHTRQMLEHPLVHDTFSAFPPTQKKEHCLASLLAEIHDLAGAGGF
jgi:hypothetical protein